MTVKSIPAGYHTVTPYLTVSNAAELIEFLKKAFDAREKERFQRPDGAIGHAEVIIGDSVIMMGEPMDGCVPTTSAFYLYVNDADAMFKQAIEAGAVSVMEPAGQFWGDRLGAVKDRFGNSWNIATHMEDVTQEELQRRMEACYVA